MQQLLELVETYEMLEQQKQQHLQELLRWEEKLAQAREMPPTT
jgi:hypothetical protein